MADTIHCSYCHGHIPLIVADKHSESCRLRTCDPEDTSCYNDMTPEEAGYQLLHNIHEREQAMSEPCDHCRIRPREIDLDFDHADIYCTQCIDSGAV